MQTHYALLYRLKGREAYLLWYSGDSGDGVILAEGNKHQRRNFVSFADLATLQRSVETSGIAEVNTEASKCHDLDALRDWLRLPEKKAQKAIDCALLLDLWNLFGDVDSSLKGKKGRNGLRNKRKYDRLYDKLFWGSNLPAVTPAGKQYKPVWSGKETHRLQKIFGAALKRFCWHLFKVAA